MARWTPEKVESYIQNNTSVTPSVKPRWTADRVDQYVNRQNTPQRRISPTTIQSPVVTRQHSYASIKPVPQSKPDGWLKRIGNAAAAGLAGAATGISKFGEMATRVQNKINPVDLIWNYFDPGQKKFEEESAKKTVELFENQQKDYQARYQKDATPTQKFVGQGVEAVSAMFPQLILSVLSGGTSLEAQASAGIANTVKSVIPGLSKGSVSRFGKQLVEMTPFMIQAGGQYARDAENQGADLRQQIAYGLAGGLSEGVTEMIPMGALKKALGVGDEVAKAAVKKGSKNVIQKFGKKGLQWIINSGEQVAQEIAVDPMTGFASKAILDKDAPWVGQNGVIDFSQMKQDAVGALGMSLVLTAMGLPANFTSHTLASKHINSAKKMTNKEVQELYNAVQKDMKSEELNKQLQDDITTPNPAQSEQIAEELRQLNNTVSAQPAGEKVNIPANVETPPVTSQEFKKGDTIIDEKGKQWTVTGTKSKTMLDITDETGRQTKIGRNVAKIYEIPIGERNFESVGNRKVKSYQSAHPELKSEIQAEANIIRGELRNGIKGERFPIKDEEGNILRWTGTTKMVSETVQRIQDATGASYVEIGKALDAIIEDNGAENTALAKRIELIIDDNLSNGVTRLQGYRQSANKKYLEKKRNIANPSGSDKIETGDNYELPGEGRENAAGDRGNTSILQDDERKAEALRRAVQRLESDGSKSISAEIATSTTLEQRQLQRLAKELGIEIVFYKSDSEIPLTGFFDSEFSDIIFIRQSDSRNMTWAVGHEFFHTLKANYPSLYEPVLNIYKKTITTEQKTKYLKKFDKIPGLQEELLNDENKLVEEMLADEAGNVFTDRNFWEDVYYKSHELFERLVEIVNELFEKLTGLEYQNYLEKEQIEQFRNDFNDIVEYVATHKKDSEVQAIADELPFSTGEKELVRELNNNALIDDVKYSVRVKEVRKPKKTIIAYKAFRVKKSEPGKLFPLFVNADKATPMGVWLEAEIGDNTKTKLGKLALRPGWHLGDLPRAKHIGKKNSEGVIDRQHPDVVWAECEVSADVDWQPEANKRGLNSKGVLIPKNADIKNDIPHNGYYRYKTNPNMEGQWIIAGAIKIKRVLSDGEVDKIQKDQGLEPIPREGGPIDLQKYGFQNNSDIRYSTGTKEERQPAKPFFSKLQQTIEQKMPYKQESDNLKNMLVAAGVKTDELKWSGIMDFLREKKIVTKQEVIDFLRMNELQINEVTKDDTEDKARYEQLTQRRDELQSMLDDMLLEGHTASRITSDIFTYQMHGRKTDRLSLYTDEEIGEMESLIDKITTVKTEIDDMQDEGLSSVDTRYSTYTLPGGENYRELLFTLPVDTQSLNIDKLETELMNATQALNKAIKLNDRKDVKYWGKEINGISSKLENAHKSRKTETYKSSHWDEKNVLAHVRFNDRTDANGNKVLFIEEIQSDWHQEGRKKGYRGDNKLPEGMKVEWHYDEYGLIDRSGNAGLTVTKQYLQNLYGDSNIETATSHFIKALEAKVGQTKVPDAPFSKTWHEFVLKRMLRYAAENGYDKIAWTTGEQQAERYDLSKSFKEIYYSKTKDGKYSVAGTLTSDENYSFPQKYYAESELEGLLGKDIALKIVNGEGEQSPNGFDTKYLRGENLKVGGKGMKGFYDKIISDYLNTYGKKWGAKVEQLTIPTGNKWVKQGSGEAARWETVGKAGDVYFISKEDGKYTVYDDYSLDVMGVHDTLEQAKASIDTSDNVQPSMIITPAMRDSVMYEGQPLYSAGEREERLPSTYTRPQYDERVGREKFKEDVRKRFEGIREFRTVPKKEAEKSNFVDIVNKVYDHVFDVLQPLNRFGKAFGEKPNEGLYQKAMAVRMADKQARIIAMQRMIDPEGNTIGKSLKEILTPLTKNNMQVFNDYLVFKHAPSWLKKGRKVFEKDLKITPADCNRMAKEIEMRHPEFIDMQNDLIKFQQKLAKEWLVDTGILTVDAWNKFQSDYPNYVPLMRTFTTAEKSGGYRPKSGYVNQRNPIKKAVGSQRAIVSPIESIIEHIGQYAKVAKKNEAGQAFLELIQKNQKDLEDVAKILDPDVIALASGLGKIVDAQILGKDGKVIDQFYVEKVLDEEGMDGVIETFNKLYQFEVQKAQGANKKNIVTVLKNGEPIKIEIYDQALLNALTQLTYVQEKAWLRALGAMTATMKNLTTGLNLSFGIARNIWRDLVTGYVSSKTMSANPAMYFKYMFDLVGAVGDMLAEPIGKKVKTGRFAEFLSKAAKHYESYQNMGGGAFASPISSDVRQLERAKQDILDEKNLWDMFINFLEVTNNTLETAPRLAEYKRVVKKEGDTYKGRSKAIYEANDLTVNFSRFGEDVKAIDSFVPFLNAAMQGIDKVIRTYKDQPTKAILKSIYAVTIPSIILYILNHRDDDIEEAYKMLNDYTKDNYFCIGYHDSEGVKFLKIPKPREIGMFGALAERLLRLWSDKDPDAFKNFSNDMMQNWYPPDPVTDNILFPAFRSFKLGQNWRYTDLENYAEQQVSPQYRYDESTSGIAKFVGGKLNISPKRLDDFFKSYFGGLAQYGIPLTSEKSGTPGKTFMAQITADPAYSTDNLNNFYGLQKRLATKKADEKAGKYKMTPAERSALSRMDDIAETFSTTRKRIEKAGTPREKRDLRLKMNLKAQDEYEKAMARFVNK
jgi:hypothetical protein